MENNSCIQQATTWEWLRFFIPLLITILIALYGDLIRRLIIGPKISIEHKNKQPFNKILNTEDSKEHPLFALFIRLRIRNVGKTTAHKVYGRVTRLEYANKNESIQYFDPTTLHWAGYPHGEKVDLGPQDYEYLDLVVIYEYEDSFSICGNPKIYRGSPLRFKTKLQPHYIFVSIYSEDAPTESEKFLLEWANPKNYKSSKLSKSS